MCRKMDSKFAVCITLCVTVLVSSTSASSWESCEASSMTTTPPLECVLPLKTGNRNHMDFMCLALDKQHPCGKIFLNGFVFNITCNEGYNLNGLDEPPVYTLYINGTWTPRIPDCKRWCKPPRSRNVDVNCQYKGETIDCTKSVPAGTEATGRCKKGYWPNEERANATIVCSENGEWNHDLVDCETPACGKMNPTDSVFPWLVTIYRNGSRKCLGTLISPHIILTSAYCVYSEGDNGVESPQSFHVAVGKKYFYRSPNTRTIHVREVSKHPQFFGDDTNYAVDIALMDLETSVSSIPACVGWSHEFHKTPGLIGTAAAWTSSSYRIQNVEYTYLDYASCVSEVKTSHRRYITLDKFCVQQITWESEASYGHGGGLMFQHNDVYYIQGIASTRVDNARTYGYTIRTFVNFSDVTMLQWFRQTIRSFDEVHQHI